MNFYKIIAKAGHQGIKRHTDIPVYLSARNISEAMFHLKRLPMVKKGNTFTTSSLTIIDEEEFIEGILTNQYNKYINSLDVPPYNFISQINNKLRFVLKEYDFKTQQGKELYNILTRYENADDEEKQVIEQEYNAWVEKLLNITNIKTI